MLELASGNATQRLLDVPGSVACLRTSIPAEIESMLVEYVELADTCIACYSVAQKKVSLARDVAPCLERMKEAGMYGECYQPTLLLFIRVMYRKKCNSQQFYSSTLFRLFVFGTF